MHTDETIREAAALWAARTSDPMFEGWGEFTAWLEAAPDHNAAYDEAMLAAEDAARLLRPIDASAELPVAANDPGDFEDRAHRRWTMPALAASLAGLLALGAWQAMPRDVHFTTAPGETRQIALGDGSSATLAGGSELVLEGGDPREARLARGQVLFRIRHDETRPFELVAGEDTLVDVGTIFDVRLGKGRLAVQVSEGAVAVNPASQNIRLDAGSQLVRVGNRYTVKPVAASVVGEWTTGRITFDNAELGDIVAQLSRATGLDISTDDSSAAARYSGSVMVAPVKADPASLAPLLGVSVRKSGASWVLSSG